MTTTHTTLLASLPEGPFAILIVSKLNFTELTGSGAIRVMWPCLRYMVVFMIFKDFGSPEWGRWRRREGRGALCIREIGSSTRRFSYKRVDHSLFLRDHRRKRSVLGAWKPELSRMRRWTASHCTFAKLGPRLGDITTTPRRFPLLPRSPRIVTCDWCVETGAERDAALVCLALRTFRDLHNIVCWTRNWTLDSAISRRRFEDSPF
jgi:hypothetical protein